MSDKSEIVSCDKCVYAVELDIDENLHRQLSCRLNPPQIIPIQTAQGVQIISGSPSVTPDMGCYRGLEKDKKLSLV